MIKSFVRWTATASLIGGVVLTSFFGTGLKALALPEEQIMQKLQDIPVFVIADDQGSPVFVNSENKKVAGIFINQEDAQKFYQNIQKQQPEIANKVKVKAVSLSQIYRLQNSQKPSDEFVFAYVPSATEVESAKQVITANGGEYQGGVPLFMARVGKDGGYITFSQNNTEILPLFFEKSAIISVVERFKKENPDLAATVKIEVIPLEGVLNSMRQSNDEVLTKIVLFPSEESVRFAQQSSQNAPQPNQPAQNRPTQPTQPSPKK